MTSSQFTSYSHQTPISKPPAPGFTSRHEEADEFTCSNQAEAKKTIEFLKHLKVPFIALASLAAASTNSDAAVTYKFLIPTICESAYISGGLTGTADTTDIGIDPTTLKNSVAFYQFTLPVDLNLNLLVSALFVDETDSASLDLNSNIRLYGLDDGWTKETLKTTTPDLGSAVSIGNSYPRFNDTTQEYFNITTYLKSQNDGVISLAMTSIGADKISFYKPDNNINLATPYLALGIDNSIIPEPSSASFLYMVSIAGAGLAVWARRMRFHE